MRKLKHLPLDQWPEADIEAFKEAYKTGDIFDENLGPGAHHSRGWRMMVETSYRRWLGFVVEHYKADLLKPPVARITPETVRAFVEQLSAEVRPTTVAMSIANLYAAAQLIAPMSDWRWLASVRAGLAARAEPEDRFNLLVPPWQTLDIGIDLMDEALTLQTSAHRQREIQCRDGLILALISLWPIRRRSLAALTVSRHVEFDAAGINFLLYPEDTKSKQAESFRVPEELLPYLLRYLREIRPTFPGCSDHDGLWPSLKCCPLTAGRIYDIVRAHVYAKFGKAMGLHDFRRAAATFIATDAPDKVGLIPGILQHASPEIGEQHYNLARSVAASRRFAAHLERTRAKLRSVQLSNEA
jgi:integrase/recombinase XerD